MTTPHLKPFYNSREWKALRLAVLRRDRYRCVACKGYGDTVHHIRDIPNHPHLALDPHNCETRCRKCHGGVDGDKGNARTDTPRKNRFLHTVLTTHK